MLGVEDLVDEAQCDVLVAATVTTDEVRVEHLVVVGAGRLVAKSADGVLSASGVGDTSGGRRVVVGVLRRRVGVVRDVGQERRVEEHGVRRHRTTGVGAGCPRRGRVVP